MNLSTYVTCTSDSHSLKVFGEIRGILIKDTRNYAATRLLSFNPTVVQTLSFDELQIRRIERSISIKQNRITLDVNRYKPKSMSPSAHDTPSDDLQSILRSVNDLFTAKIDGNTRDLRYH
jgi:hypothetical protein